METSVRLAGFAITLLALGHVAMPRALRWADEMTSLTPLNRQVHYAHYFFLALTLLGIGLLAFLRAPLLLSGDDLARLVAGGIGVFFGIRLAFEFCYFDTAVWRGDRLKTLGHVGFAILWMALTATFLVAAVTGGTHS